MSISTSTKEFIEEYLTEPLEKYTKEQIMESLQEYLIKKGYGKELVTGAVEFVTNGGYGVDFSSFLITEGDSKFAKKIANMDVAKLYSYYAKISTFAAPVNSLYNNLSDFENYINENGTLSAEAKKRLENSLYDFLTIAGDAIDYTPGGFIYSAIFSGLDDGISYSIEMGKNIIMP